MWSARRLSITTTTTFIAPTGALPSLTSWPAASCSLSQAAALISVRPAAPAPPARSTSRRVSSSAKPLGGAPRDVDRADRVLVGELVQHLAQDLVDVALVVTEVVEHGLQRRPGDLELGRGQIQPVRDLVGTDQVELVVSHERPKGSLSGGGQDLGTDRIARQLPRYSRTRLSRDRCEGAPPRNGRADRARRPDRLLRHGGPGVRRDRAGHERAVRGPWADLAGKARERRPLPVALRDRAGARPRRGGLRARRRAGGRARARGEVARRALDARG